jgi:hypothetical protein
MERVERMVVVVLVGVGVGVDGVSGRLLSTLLD